MLSYFLKCRKNKWSENLKVDRTKKWKMMLLLKFVMCDSKKKIIKQQETNILLSSLGIKPPLSKIPLVGLLLF